MSLVACIALTGRLHYIRAGATGRLRVRSTTRSSFWSLMRKVRKSVHKRLVACYIFMRMLLVACMVDWLPPVMVVHHIS